MSSSNEQGQIQSKQSTKAKIPGRCIKLIAARCSNPHDQLSEQDLVIQHTKPETDLITQSSARSQKFQGTAIIIAARCIKIIASSNSQTCIFSENFHACLDRGELTS